MSSLVRGDKTEVIRLRVSKDMKTRWEEYVIASGKDEGSLSAFISRHIEEIKNFQPVVTSAKRSKPATKI